MNKNRFAGLIVVLLFIVLVIVRNTTIQNYQNTCEAMSDKYGNSWLECDLHTTQVMTEDGTIVNSTFYKGMN